MIGGPSETSGLVTPPVLTRVNPFFSNEKPGRRSRRSPSGDFGKLISKSLERANRPCASWCACGVSCKSQPRSFMRSIPGNAGTHTGHMGAHGHTEHTHAPHNHPNANPPTVQHRTHPHLPRDDRMYVSAADSRASSTGKLAPVQKHRGEQGQVKLSQSNSSQVK